MFAGRFGKAGDLVVVEEFLEGEEASFIAMVDGKTVLPLATSQDHKRLRDADEGPNTGGMGAYSPAPVVTPEMHERIMREVMLPTVAALAREGTPYLGFLYAGIMIHPDGTPNVLEFNCRFGDPETQPILARMRSDLTSLCEAALDGKLEGVEVDWDPRAAVGVVMAAGGYPDDVRKGDEIHGLDAAAKMPGKVFHAGTTLNAAGKVVTNGGRVLCAVGLGTTVRAAQKQAYELAGTICWEGLQYRKDIGYPRDRAGVVAPAGCAGFARQGLGCRSKRSIRGLFPSLERQTRAREEGPGSTACGTAPERVPGQARERRTAHRHPAEARGMPVDRRRVTRRGELLARSIVRLRPRLPAFLSFLSFSYGVYQIGDVYARSCVVIGTSGVIFTP